MMNHTRSLSAQAGPHLPPPPRATVILPSDCCFGIFCASRGASGLAAVLALGLLVLPGLSVVQAQVQPGVLLEQQRQPDEQKKQQEQRTQPASGDRPKFSLHPQDELFIANRTELLSFQVRGRGKASSFYDPRANYLHETDLRWNTVLREAWNSTLNASIRLTDSKQFDIDRESLQKLEWRVWDHNTQMNFGDYFANFSQYALSKGIKGAAFQRDLEDDQNYVRAAYGSFDGLWRYVHSPYRVGNPMDRYGGGLRLQRAGEKARFGLNLAHVRDRLYSDPDRGAQDAFEQYIPALDWEYRDSALVISGEHAYSATGISSSAGTARSLNGTAHKLVLRAALADLNIDSQFERVSPTYITLSGGATADRLRGYARVEARVARLWRVFGLFDYTHNNLASQLDRSTYNFAYEGGLTKRRAFDRRDLMVSLSLRQRVTDTTDNSANRTSDRVKLRVTDRLLDVVDFRGDAELVLDKDRVPATRSRARSVLWNLGLNSRHSVGKDWDLAPSIDYSRQEAQNVAAAGTDVQDTLRIGLQANRTNGTQVGFNYEKGVSTLATPNANSHRGRYNVFYLTKPDWMSGGSIKLDYQDNANYFDDASRNYGERLLRVLFQYDFERLSK